MCLSDHTKLGVMIAPLSLMTDSYYIFIPYGDIDFSDGIFKCIISILHLSHDVSSGSDIMPCNKIDKPLVVNRLLK